MKKTLLLLNFTFCILHAAFCQNPLIKQWDKRFGGTGAEYLHAFKQTKDGGYILGGFTTSDSSGDKTQNRWGYYDYWVVKTDSLGIKQWDKDFGGTTLDQLTSIDETADGGYILGGISNSDSSGDKTQASWGNQDYWIVKIDSLGNKQWDRDFGGTSDDQLWSLQQSNDGGYILGGYSNSGVGGDKTQPCWGQYDYWIVKTDSFGIKQWDKRFGGTSLDLLEIIRQTSDNGYVLGGYSYSTISGDKTQGNWDPTSSTSDYWIVKINSIGTKQWDKRFGGLNSDWLFACEQSTDGGFIFGGFSDSQISGNKTQNTWGGSNDFDYWIVKINSMGNKQWDRDFGGINDEDNLGSISQTSEGGYLISGRSYSNISGDKTENNLGNNQTWVVKIDSLGIKQWDKTVRTDTGSGVGIGFGIQINDGCYAIANSTNAGIGGDKTEPNWDTANIHTDYWIIKFCDSTATTGISNYQTPNSNFQIFPNPTNDFITVSFTSAKEKNVSVEVYDLFGREVANSNYQISNSPVPIPSGNFQIKIDISDFNSGVYIVEIKRGGDFYRKKIVKM
ncbi:MAG: T9SS type A sorting domain-containing protein [Bacteroidia bacterium]